MTRALSISRRRLLHGVGTLGVALAAGCGPGPLIVASPTPRLRRIGFLTSLSRSVESLRRELGELGYVEGRDFAFHERDSQGVSERLPALASELVETPVDVIVTIGFGPTAAARAATSSIPIVFSNVANPVARGLVADMAWPGGNLTGTTGVGIVVKQLELLKETVPGLVRVAHLGARVTDLANITSATQDDCRALGLECLGNVISSPTELEAALGAIERTRPDALFVWVGVEFLGAAGLERVIAFAIEHRLPQLFQNLASARAGGLIGMGASGEANWRIVARQVDKILRGANPGDLPVEENTVFDITLNRSMARKIGFTFPDNVLRRATEVVDIP